MPTKKSVRVTDKVLCGGCYKVSFQRRYGHPNANGVLHCRQCAKTLPQPKKRGRPPKGEVRNSRPRNKRKGMDWYVLQCFPGKEGLCRKSINRKVRIEGLEGGISRILIPTRLENQVVSVYKTLASEKTEDPVMGKFVAAQRAAELLGVREFKPHEHEGIRTRVYRNRETGTWEWRVERLTGTEHRTLRRPKTPGYILVEMNYSPDLHYLIDKTRHSWGFLLRPIDRVDHRLKVKFNVRKGGWVFSLRKDGKKLPLEGVRTGPFKTESEAKSHGIRTKIELERFVPTPIAKTEADALLKAERAVRDIVKDRAEKNRVYPSVRVGDSAVVAEGLWKNAAGVVTAVDQSDKTKPMVTLRCRIRGLELPLTLPAWEVKTA